MRLVGRESELEIVDRFLEAARAGPAGLVLTGAPGIGKTELWREGQRRAASGGYRVLTARPVEVEASFSFAALGDLLGEADAFLNQLPAPQRRALEVALLRREDGGPVEPRAVAIATLSLLRALAAVGPILLAVDDVQWLDTPSLSVLEYAVRRLRTEAIAILATRREDSTDHDVPLLRAVAGSAGARLPVKPLSLGAMHQLLHERIGPGLQRYTVLRVYEVSAGNPMVALEVARLLAEQGVHPRPGEELPVPVSVQALLAQRLSAVSPATLQVLAIAASLAQPSTELLARAAPRTAMPALEKASQAGLVEVIKGRVEFTHPLLRFVVRSGMSDAQRRQLHARLATLAEQSEERVRHLALSVDRADEGVAAQLESVALTVIARGAPVAGGELLEQAATLTPGTLMMEAARRRLAAANASFLAGDARRCRTLLEDLLPALPHGRLRSEALCQLGLVRCFTDDVARGTELLEQSAGEASDDPERRFAALVTLALGKASRLQIAECRQLLEDALRLAESSGHETGATEAMSSLSFWRFVTGDESFGDLLERAKRRARVDPTVRLTFGPDFWSAQILRCTDQLQAASNEIQLVHARAEEQGDEGSLLPINNVVAEIDLAAGAWPSALQHATESAEIAARYGFLAFSVLGHALRGVIQAHLGLEGDARASLATGSDAANQTGFLSATMYLRWARGFLELSRGNPKGADEQLGDIAAMTVAFGVVEPGAIPWHLDEVEALVALGRLDDAEALLVPYLEAAERRERRWCRAAGLRCRALLNAARGNLQSALDDARVAATLAEEGQRPFELARCLLVKGIVERRANNRAAATIDLRRAETLFERLEARLWLARARDELRRAEGKPHSGDALSATEFRVAKLAAEGRSNPEIAAALFMSRKTVEANLARTYRKLGVRMRVQLAGVLDGASHSQDTPWGAREPAPKK
jgi:DNA-binding CsgD family transcriptional regulator